MGYINDFRAKLRRLIEAGETEHAIQYAADTVLESYRNGVEIGSRADTHDAPAQKFPKRQSKNAPR